MASRVGSAARSMAREHRSVRRWVARDASFSVKLPIGPDAEAVARYILERFPDTFVATVGAGTFFSCDASHWPNFATIVTSDQFDSASDLARPDVFRLNIGVSPETFDRVVGDRREVDHAALDALLPHPVYARQQWVCVLNPSHETFDRIVKPLLDEAHARVAARSAQRRGASSARSRRDAPRPARANQRLRP